MAGVAVGVGGAQVSGRGAGREGGGAAAGWLGSWGQPGGLARGNRAQGPGPGLGPRASEADARRRSPSPGRRPAPPSGFLPHTTPPPGPPPSSSSSLLPQPGPLAPPRVHSRGPHPGPHPFPCVRPLSPLQYCPALPAAPAVPAEARVGLVAWRWKGCVVAACPCSGPPFRGQGPAVLGLRWPGVRGPGAEAFRECLEAAALGRAPGGGGQGPGKEAEGGKKRRRPKKKKAYSTRYSQAVSHPSTNQARPCLASEIRRDRARSGWYGRRRLPLQLGALRAC